MIIELKGEPTPEALEEVTEALAERGYSLTPVQTQRSFYLVGIGKEDIDLRRIGSLASVKDVHRVSDPYKLVSRKWKASATEIDLGDGVCLREGEFSIAAGPCSIESEAQVDSIIEFLSKEGVRIVRGGAFKPRTSPYAFRGLGIDGLKMLFQKAKERGIRVVSEVMEISQIETMYDWVDVYQVGARNTQNFSLLHELGNVDKPVLLKRGVSGTIEELLQSAEYVFANGNERLILCERGIRTYENAYRNTLDINAVPILKEKSHLPVIVDPSHGIGIRRFVSRVALSGVVAGADGLLVEIHEKPKQALSDGQQTLDFAQASRLFRHARELVDLRQSWSIETE